MKFIHISDLHIGKRLNEYNLTEDQRYILDRIIETVEKEAPDCVLIAGDVYDRTVPPVDAVELLDEFLVRLSALGTEIFVISGNHDSSERIAFGRCIFLLCTTAKYLLISLGTSMARSRYICCLL